MTVRYETRGTVAVITIDRPERRNAIDRATAKALADAWQRFASDDGIAVAVLYGAGGVFSAGADLVAFDLEDTPGGWLGFTRTQVDKPTIAAVEGYCVAGGLEMALWCDLRIAGAGAVFGCFERRYGVPLVDGGTQRLPRIVGLGRALDMILTGRPVDAAEALEMGLVNAVVAEGEALSEAVALAERIAAFPQETLRADRRAVYGGLGLQLAEGLELERREGAEVLDVARRGAERFAAARAARNVQTPPPQAPAEVVVRIESEGIEEGRPGTVERFPTPAGTARAYVSLPVGRRGPGVVVVHDWWGQRSSHRDVADRLAEAGFVAMAVDLYDGVLAADTAQAEELMMALDRPTVSSHLAAAVDALVAHPAVTGERVGIVGYSFGGGLALWLSTLDRRVAACVTYYGAVPWTDVRPDFGRAEAAFLGHYASEDRWASPHVAADLERGLRDLGRDATFHVYPATAHGFADPAEPTFAPSATGVAWERTVSFLRRILAPTSTLRPE